VAHANDTTPPAAPPPATRRAQYLSLRSALGRAALVSAAFTAVIAIVFTADHLAAGESVILDDPQIISLKAALAKAPADEALKERIRALDLEMRRGFFRRQMRITYGKYFLLAGVVVFVVALKLRYDLAKPMPKPGATLSIEADDSLATRSRVSLGAVAVASLGGMLALGLSWSSPLLAPAVHGGETSRAGQAEDVTLPVPVPIPLPPPPEASYATGAEMAANWPLLFGPGGAASRAFTGVPLKWDGESGENILWKTAFPLPGASSPVVWGDRAYLTGADTATRTVYCVSTKDGSILWQTDTGRIPGGGLVIEELWDTYTYAACTPATDGYRVYASFANGDVVCLDADGAMVWARGMGPMHNGYGHASSLGLYERTLILLYDQKKPKDAKPDEFQSKIMALDLVTGKTTWETARPSIESWTTPLVAELAGRKQLIAAGNPYVFSYDPATGAELWRAKCLSGDVTPSPVTGAGLVFAGMEGGDLVAIRPDGAGDVTDTHIVWRAQDDVPSIPTPACDGERLYTLAGTGFFTCYEAATGTKLWDADLELAFMASPVVMGEHVYVFSDDGACVILKAAPAFEEVARNSIGEEVRGTPAFAEGRIYVRGHEHLMCIGSAGP
jgi:outer membrane protein assembly factor BamB